VASDRNLVKEIEGIGGVVDEDHAVAGFENQAKECAGSWWRAAAVQQRLRDLRAFRSNFRDEAIVAIYGQDVTTLRNGEPQRSIEAAIFSERGASSS